MAFKEIFSGGLFPGGFLSGGFYPDTGWDISLIGTDPWDLFNRPSERHRLHEIMGDSIKDVVYSSNTNNGQNSFYKKFFVNLPVSCECSIPICIGILK